MKPQKFKRTKDTLLKQRIQKYIARYPTYKQPVWLNDLCEEEARKIWEQTDWRAIQNEIDERKMLIVKCYIEGDMDGVYRRQKELVKLPVAGWWAVRKVSSGDKAMGIDEQKWDTYVKKVCSVYHIQWIQRKLGRYKPSGIKRVWIPKGQTGKMRPLGIPTFLDRAFQGLLLNALEPIHEHKGDENSFGFRKGRGTQHAIARLRATLGKQASSRWLLDADIQQCFDSISHQSILSKVVCWDARVIKKIIRAPIIDLRWESTASPRLCVFPKKGTPQGGLISPLLCNIALDGLEKVIEDSTPVRKRSKAKRRTVRYADDFVLTAIDHEDASNAKAIVSQFLADRGLSLNDSKTAVINIRQGLEYLSWEIRLRKRVGKLNMSSNPQRVGGDWRWVLVIRPSKESVKSIRERIISCFRKWEKKGYNPYALTCELNTIVRGWCMYFRYSYHSQVVFIGLGNLLWRRMLHFLKRKHPRTPVGELVEKYNKSTESRKWNWYFTNKKGREVRLFDPTRVKQCIQRPHKYNQSYYTEDGRLWWSKQAQSVPQAMAIVELRKQAYARYAGRCGMCGELLTDEGNEWLKLNSQGEILGLDPVLLWNMNPSGIELHRILAGADGGKYVSDNVMPVHSHCHLAYHRLNPLKVKGIEPKPRGKG